MGAWIETSLVPESVAPVVVAPYMGAWIETLLSGRCCSTAMSHPTWVRGLKQGQERNAHKHHQVAPYMGAWIETVNVQQMALQPSVAPYMGAWIETYKDRKPVTVSTVAPYMGAWIETETTNREYYEEQSHPTWVRGLKPTIMPIFAKTKSRTLHGCVD